MKSLSLNIRPHQESDRGCVVLDQPQRFRDSGVLRLVCDTAALLLVLLLFSLVCFPTHAATQVGSAPYRASATGAGNSHSPVFSGDGKHVAFVSHANNLVTNDDLAPHLDLFVRDLVTSNTVLVSVSTNGFGGANDNIGLYTLSSNAQVIAFDTSANNLVVRDDNRVSDIFMRNLMNGSLTRVSVGINNTGNANGPSSNPLISEDGRYVIFESLASNLVTNDFNGTNDIFIHDLMTGLTELISVNADGTVSPDGPSHSPSISADGLTVAFVSHATNLVEGVTNRLGEVYARNVAAGTTRWAVASHMEETRARIPNTSELSPYVATEPVLSSDGHYALFKTLGSAVRFDLHRPTNSVIEWTIRTNSTIPSNISALLFQFHDNPRLGGDVGRSQLSLSRNGQYAAFETATNFVPYPGNLMPPRGIRMVDFELLVTNYTAIGCGPWRCPVGYGYTLVSFEAFSEIVLTNSTQFVGGETWTSLPWLHLSTDASRLCFLVDATNLVASVTNRVFQIYGLDVATGGVTQLSKNGGGKASSDLSAISPTALPDGSLIAWDSPDDNIVADDLNHAWDVFVRNVDTGETQLISARHPDLPPATGRAMARIAAIQSISGDGSRIVLLSRDSNLTTNDTNNLADAVLRDLRSQTNTAVSGPFYSPIVPGSPFFGTVQPTNEIRVSRLNASGRYVMFAGSERSFTSPTSYTLGLTNLHWRDLELNTNYNVSGPLGGSSAMSIDGHMVAYESVSFQSGNWPDPNRNAPDVVLIDLRVLPGARYLISKRRDPPNTTANGPSINPAFSPDSRWLVFQSLATDLTYDTGNVTDSQLYAREIDTALIKRISYSSSDQTNAFPLSGGATNSVFSTDAHFVFFEGVTSNTIYRHDLLNDMDDSGKARRPNLIVCTGCANPSASSEGRFVAYESRPGPGAGTNIFVKDLASGQVELISMSMTGTNGNGPSFTPLLSHDTRFVVFTSRASDLVPGDNNRATDIFVRDRLNSVTHCLSRNWSGTGTGNRVSSNPILSADGRTVAFQSFASDLVPGDYNDTRDVFVVTLGSADTDGDGMDDDWEMAYFSTLSRDGFGDFDNDGASDLAEFRAGTNPANDASILRVLTLTTSLGAGPNPSRSTVLLWSAIPGKTYRVQFKAGLDDAWTTAGADLTASSTTASLADTVEAPEEPNNPHRFYRVLLVQ